MLCVVLSNVIFAPYSIKDVYKGDTRSTNTICVGRVVSVLVGFKAAAFFFSFLGLRDVQLDSVNLQYQVEDNFQIQYVTAVREGLE